MINWIKKLFNKQSKVIWHNFNGIVKRDKSGRLRHKIYIDGNPAKDELSIFGWYTEKIK